MGYAISIPNLPDVPELWVIVRRRINPKNGKIYLSCPFYGSRAEVDANLYKAEAEQLKDYSLTMYICRAGDLESAIPGLAHLPGYFIPETVTDVSHAILERMAKTWA